MKVNGHREFWTTLIIGAVLFMLPSTVAIASPLWDGLINYWALNEGTGAVANDTAPNGAVADTGTVRNSPTWITSDGPFNTGLQFTGTQDVLLANSGDMNFGANAVTLSAWVKLDMLPAASPTDFMGILDSAQDNFVMYLDRGNNELRFKATTQVGPTVISTVGAQHVGVRASQLNTTDWVHVMGVYDGSEGAVRLYYNGQLADVTTQASPVAQLLTGPIRPGQIASIGAEATTAVNNPGNRFFQGGITDVAVWNRPLGLAEAQYLYNSGTGNAVGAANPTIAPVSITPSMPAVQPVAYYPFDGNLQNYGTGGPALDAVRQGTPLNATIFTPTDYGQGLDFRQNPNATDGDWLAVNYTLPDQGTIALRFTADKLYDFQALWDNSVNANHWEMWIYNDGRVATRVQNGTPILAYNIKLDDEQFDPHHLAFTWERDGSNVRVRLYVDGVWVDERIGPWQAPGSTFFIGGGNAGNDVGSGIWDEFRIYDVALNESEILGLSQVPEPQTAVLLGGMSAGVALCLWNRRMWQQKSRLRC